MYKKINFLGIPIDALTMQETINKIENTILSNRQIHHSAVNAGKIVLMQNDEKLKKSVLEADLINADGQGVVWATSFFGADESVVTKVVKKYSSLYSDDIIAGYLNGYYCKEEEKKIVDEIVRSKANILFVAITSPKKEMFLNKYKEELKSINLIMGVGGSFDVVSGKIKRAPEYMQKIGLEWLFRFSQEPIYLVIKNKAQGN